MKTHKNIHSYLFNMPGYLHKRLNEVAKATGLPKAVIIRRCFDYCLREEILEKMFPHCKGMFKGIDEKNESVIKADLKLYVVGEVLVAAASGEEALELVPFVSEDAIEIPITEPGILFSINSKGIRKGGK